MSQDKKNLFCRIFLLLFILLIIYIFYLFIDSYCYDYIKEPIIINLSKESIIRSIK